MVDEKEIILVGSGLSACTLAWKLYQKNISFSWFADNAPAASNAAYGILNPIHFRNASKSWKEDYFYTPAVNFYIEISKQLQVAFAKETTIYHFLNDEEEAIYFRQQSECGELGNYSNGELVFLDDKTIQPAANGGILIEKALHIQIPVYVKQTIQFFAALDVVKPVHFEIEQLHVSESSVTYDNILAQKVIFCEGKYIENNPYFAHVPLNLSKGEVIEIQTTEKLPAFALHKKVFILHQHENSYLVGATTAWDDYSFETTEKAKIELENDASAILKTSFFTTNQRCGIRPAMADRRPILGTHPTYSSIAVLNGMGSKGLFFAPQSAELLIDHLLNHVEIPFDLSIRRFDRRYRTWLEKQKST